MWVKAWALLPAAVFVICLVGYGLTLCPTVYVEGSGELIGATYLLGTAHPTGYPLFCLGGRLFAAVMPWGNPAFKINLFTACSAAAAAAALAVFLRYRGCRDWVAAGAAVGFGFSATFWSQAVIAEVYGLSLLAAILTLGLGLAAATQQDERLLLLLGWTMGLGLTCHLNQVLVWPGILSVLLWKWPRLRRPGWVHLRFAASLMAGYSVVVYLVLRNGLGPGFHWGLLDQWDLLWQHLSGALYRSSFFSLPFESMWLNARRWGMQMLNEFHSLLLPVAVWGLWCCLRRDRAACIAVGGAVIANLLMAFNYQRDPNGLGVFFLLSFLGMAVFLGFALEDLARRLPGLPSVVLACLLPIGVFANNYIPSDRSGVWTAHTYGSDILDALPVGAILISEGDNASYILDYLHRVEGKRPDVRLFNRVGRGSDLLPKAEQRLALRPQHRARKRREIALLKQADAPVYYLHARAMVSKEHRFVPEGLVYRAWPTDQKPPLLGAQIPMQNAAVSGANNDPWIRKIQANYWFMQGENKFFEGQKAEAIEAFRQAAEVAHDSRTMLYNVAVKLMQADDLANAWNYGQQALQRDPFQPQVYKLLARIARLQGRFSESDNLLKRADKMRSSP